MAVLGQPSPRKVVPLSGGPADLQRTKSEQPAIPPTRRVYYCGVVIEAGIDGHPIAQGTNARYSTCKPVTDGSVFA